jgi:hypothetical protein
VNKLTLNSIVDGGTTLTIGLTIQCIKHLKNISRVATKKKKAMTFDVGSVVLSDVDEDESYVVIRIRWFGTSTTMYDIQSVLDGFVYTYISKDRLRLAPNQDLTGNAAYDRAMKGI